MTIDRVSAYDDTAPGVRVVKGEPTEEELAALLLVLRKQAATRSRVASTGVHGWTDRSRFLRRYVRTGAGAWRATAWVDR